MLIMEFLYFWLLFFFYYYYWLIDFNNLLFTAQKVVKCEIKSVPFVFNFFLHWFSQTAIPPVIMNALEKKAFMKV